MTGCLIVVAWCALAAAAAVLIGKGIKLADRMDPAP